MGTIDGDVAIEQQVWTRVDSLEFFSEHRNRVEDLYPSERRFLPQVLPVVRSVLDIGCAGGGFSRIMKAFNPAVEYTGVDVNSTFVERATAAYPDSRFLAGDGIHFDTPPNSYDLVHSMGILHLNSRYEEIVRAGYEQARRFLLCDFRLTPGSCVEGTFRLAFKKDDSQERLLPYIVPNTRALLDMLLSLRPGPARVSGFGYYHPPSSMAEIPLSEVLMAVFLIEKDGGGSGPTVIDLDWPDAEAATR